MTTTASWQIEYPAETGETGVTDTQYPVGDVRRYGAVGDGVTDDSTAFTSCVDSLYALGKSRVLLNDLSYIVNGVATNINMLRLDLIGDNASIICNGATPSITFNPYTDSWTSYNLASNAAIGTNTITVTGHDFEVHDTIYFQSTTAGETAFSYKKAGAYDIVAITGDVLTLDRKLRFSFTTSDLVFRNDKDSFLYARGVTAKRSGGAGSTCISVRYCAGALIEGCGVGAIGSPAIVDGWVFNQSSEIKFRDFDAKDCRYPVQMSAGKNGIVDGITGNNVRHLVDFANFFEYGTVKNFSGVTRQGGVNTHPAFNISYIDGTTVDTEETSNHRAIGGTLKNITANFGEDAGTDGMYWGVSLVETELVENPIDYGLLLHIENFKVYDNRTGAGAGGVQMVSSGTARDVVYRNTGSATVSGDFYLKPSPGYKITANIKNIDVDNCALVPGSYFANNADWDDSNHDIKVEGDPVINCVVESGDYVARFRDSPNFTYNNGVWKYKGSVFAKETLTSLDFIFESSPVTNTFPDRNVRVTFYFRSQRDAHLLKSSFYVSGTTVTFGTADLIDHSSDVTKALVAIGSPTVAANRDVTLPLTLTKGSAGWNGWMDYEVEIEYL